MAPPAPNLPLSLLYLVLIQYSCFLYISDPRQTLPLPPVNRAATFLCNRTHPSPYLLHPPATSFTFHQTPPPSAAIILITVQYSLPPPIPHAVSHLFPFPIVPLFQSHFPCSNANIPTPISHSTCCIPFFPSQTVPLFHSHIPYSSPNSPTTLHPIPFSPTSHNIILYPISPFPSPIKITNNPTAHPNSFSTTNY